MIKMTLLKQNHPTPLVAEQEVGEEEEEVENQLNLEEMIKLERKRIQATVKENRNIK